MTATTNSRRPEHNTLSERDLSPAKATSAPINIDAIPLKLRAEPQWLTWRWEIRDGKLTKPPYNARTGGAGSSTDSSTWSTFSEACQALAHGNDGIGYALRPDSGIAGIDLDDCVDPDTRAIDPWALDIVERVDSYTEISPSGRGLRIFLLGMLPGSGHKKSLHAADPERYPRTKAALELYDQRRYLTVTGQHIDSTPRVLRKRQDAFRAIHDEFWPAPSAATPSRRPTTMHVSLDDRELLEHMFAAKNGHDIRQLWDGDTSAHSNDWSGADQAMMNHLAWWTNHDPARMERLFGQTALAQRDKWQRPDYRQSTIDKADRDVVGGYTSEPGRQNDDLGDEIADNGSCPNCARLERKLAELQARFDWQDKFRRKRELTAGDKLVGAALADLHAAAEARGQTDRIPIVIEASRDLDEHPERAAWPDRTLTGRTGLSRSTISRSLRRFADEQRGVWRLESEEVLNKEGLTRPRLYLVPKASAAATRAAVLNLEPLEAEPAQPKPARPIRCAKHPMARVNEDTTWRCQLCGRHCRPARHKPLDPTDYVPAVQNDELVTGEARPGPAPGRNLWADFPALQNDDLGNPPGALSPVDTNSRHSDELAPRYWPVYDRLPRTDQAPVVSEHCCQGCGAFADVQWGPVVAVGPPDRQVWLHAGADAPCRVPSPVAV